MAHEAGHALALKYVVGQSIIFKPNWFIYGSVRFKADTSPANIIKIMLAGPLTELGFSYAMMKVVEKLPARLPGRMGLNIGFGSGIITSLAALFPIKLKISGKEMYSDSHVMWDEIKKAK